jgi:diaminopimelate decarboxylase
VFAGVGKTESEIEFALRRGVYSFNAESEPELQRINRVAAPAQEGRARRRARESERGRTQRTRRSPRAHTKTNSASRSNKSKVCTRAQSKLKNLRLRGVQMHIGSQLTEVSPFEKAVRKAIPLVQRLKARHGIEFFSIGGGLGIIYQPALASGNSSWWKSAGRKYLTPQKYAARLVPLLKPLGLRILMEPGRFISGNAGILVTRVEYVKRTGKKNFVIVDAAMNDLIRPAFLRGVSRDRAADAQSWSGDQI